MWLTELLAEWRTGWALNFLNLKSSVTRERTLPLATHHSRVRRVENRSHRSLQITWLARIEKCSKCLPGNLCEEIKPSHCLPSPVLSEAGILLELSIGISRVRYYPSRRAPTDERVKDITWMHQRLYQDRTQGLFSEWCRQIPVGLLGICRGSSYRGLRYSIALSGSICS